MPPLIVNALPSWLGSLFRACPKEAAIDRVGSQAGPALAGIALGGIWTADRTFLTRLAPPEQTGEFFGLYQLAGRFAAVTGPLIWGLTVDSLTDLGLLRFRIAILVLLINVVLGFIVLMGVKERQESGEESPPLPGAAELS